MLKRFHVLNSESDQNLEGIDYPLLLNLDHIASVKNINIMYKGNIIKGYWIRMVNGKKYKATRVPSEIKKMLEEDSGETDIQINGTTMKGHEASREISYQ
jgi:hypothetical protein